MPGLSTGLQRIKKAIRQFSPARRTRHRLSRAHLSGHGIEVGALHSPLPTSDRAHVKYVDRLSRADLLKHYPELAGTDVVDPDIVDIGEELGRISDGTLDFVIANHFIEHCENPIRTLQNFFAKLKRGGMVYMAVPDKRFTFDVDRPSTSFEHLRADHADNGAAARRQHYVEFTRFAHFKDMAPERDVEAQADRWDRESYSIHFHVWTYDEFRSFLEGVKRDYLPALEIVEAVRNQDEGIFLLRKSVRADA